MEASHLLLGRPWQFDRSVLHDGQTNKYSFMHSGQKISLAPLSPSEECEEVFPKKVPQKFERIVFEPRGCIASNSMTNSFEEGEYDEGHNGMEGGLACCPF
ncbi:Gag-Pol polyprotein/retrotransposon, putative [Medicago truncatula]|uniref:Gag-Pol polyprotein/retrotransposon, putative n=1 Tax=Medicago truncatula TaxID=3880 RepID=A0A072TR63_MEDTR|nr:Gag-Pol polyprotein/retrotransposon, putative [Medicago truncatula]